MPTLPPYPFTHASDSRESETCLVQASIESSVSDHVTEKQVLEWKQGDLESITDRPENDSCDWSPSIGDHSRFYSCMWTA